jgi:Ser/Thr protein kinase RdoA (MazF antagonist)
MTWDKLSFTAKLHRLHALALDALTHYDLKDPQLTYHAFETNLLYRVTTAAEERFMLRLASPGWRTFEDLQSEALWLDALCRETCVSAPRVIPARTGEYVLKLSHPDIPWVRNTSLMTWVPGRLMGHYLTPRNLEKMGELFAQMHQHGKAWVPPACFTTRRFVHWLSRGEKNLITGDGRSDSAGIQQESNALQPLATASLASHQRELLERLHQHVEQAYARVNTADLRVIHCDLWHDNIKLNHGVLHPIDFEDTVWGYRVHDIAMAMLDLLETAGDDRYPDLLKAFWRGYTALMSIPDDPIEPFQVGRLLWKINWVANYQPQYLSKMVDNHVPLFEYYEQTGYLLKPPVN